MLCLVTQSGLTLCEPMDCSLPGSSVHGDSPGKNNGVGCLALLQGIFPTQGSNPGLPHCRRILYHLSHQGSPQDVKRLLNINLIWHICLTGLPLQETEEIRVGFLGQEYPRGVNGNPLQCSCLENSMDRGAWQATVHGLTKSQTQLNDLALTYSL